MYTMAVLHGLINQRHPVCMEQRQNALFHDILLAFVTEGMQSWLDICIWDNRQAFMT